MTRALLLFLTISVSLYANIKHLEGVYNIKYGIFGELGKAEAIIIVDDNKKYEIKAKAYTTGIAKYLSGNLVENYISKGEFVAGKYRPQYFKKEKTKRGNTYITEFIFDHKNKTIVKKEYKKEKKQKPITDLSDPISYQWKESKKEQTLPFWTNEDILSLFFNIKQYIKKFDKGSKAIVSAVGASDKREGKIDIIIPSKEKYLKLQSDMNSDGDIFIVKIYKKIFASKDGEFFLSLDKDGICNKSILKDVLFFGDIVGTLEKKKNKI